MSFNIVSTINNLLKDYYNALMYNAKSFLAISDFTLYLYAQKILKRDLLGKGYKIGVYVNDNAVGVIEVDGNMNVAFKKLSELPQGLTLEVNSYPKVYVKNNNRVESDQSFTVTFTLVNEDDKGNVVKIEEKNVWAVLGYADTRSDDVKTDNNNNVIDYAHISLNSCFYNAGLGGICHEIIYNDSANITLHGTTEFKGYVFPVLSDIRVEDLFGNNSNEGGSGTQKTTGPS